MLKYIFTAFGLWFVLSGCLKGEDGFKCLYEPCDFVAPAIETAAIQTYLDSNSINATKHCSGLFYIIDSLGTGVSPDACNGVSVTYTGRLTDGSVFDAGSIVIGLNQVIPGWTNGLPLIKSGGGIRLFIPPSLGYGGQAQPGIPAHSILIFDVQLHAVL